MNQPEDLDSEPVVRHSLLGIVRVSLDSNPTLLPRSAVPDNRDDTPSAARLPDLPETSDSEVDDFTIMSEKQAKRISSLVKLTFGVDISVDVVIADANVGALARRITGARSLIMGC